MVYADNDNKHPRTFIRIRRGLACLIAGLLCACEAPLDLAGVEHVRELAVRRYDQFQAAASNRSVVVVVGARGVVLAADTASPEWQRQELPGGPALIDVTVCPDGRFAALDVQRRLWLAGSAARDWRAVAIDTQETPQAIGCDRHNTLWVVASFATILSTRDDGRSWHAYSLEEDLFLTSIQFVGAKKAYVTGEFGVVLKSDDGGETWQSLAPLPDELYPLAAYFNERGEGWVAGLKGIILHTADDGQSWSVQQTPTEMPLYALAPKASGLYAAGEHGVLLHFDGRRWRQLEYDVPVRSYLRALLPLNDGLLAAGGSGALRVLRGLALQGDRE